MLKRVNPDVLLKMARARHPQYEWEYCKILKVCMATVILGRLHGEIGRYRIYFTQLEATTGLPMGVV